MNYEIVVQRGNGLHSNSLGVNLEKRLLSGKFDELHVAMAYVTVAGVPGVRSLIDYLDASKLKSKWLIGLDDFITQPGAIDLLINLPRTDVRLVSLNATGARFHSKFCHFSKSTRPNLSILMMGSANLTKSALSSNAESVTFYESRTVRSREAIDIAWRNLWSQGKLATTQAVLDYRVKYNAAKKLRKKLAVLDASEVESQVAARPKPKTILSSDKAELDPSLASVTWIECGKMTAQGRELELKAEQSLFFHVASDSIYEDFVFRTSDDTETVLRLKYQEANGMWRVQLNNTVPEIRTGLRKRDHLGRLQRSAYAAVFTRLPKNVFELRFLPVSGREFASLKSRTRALGTLGRTMTREYGWC